MHVDSQHRMYCAGAGLTAEDDILAALACRVSNVRIGSDCLFRPSLAFGERKGGEGERGGEKGRGEGVV